MTDVLNGTNLCHFAGVSWLTSVPLRKPDCSKDTEPSTALCLSPSGQHLFSFGSSLSLRVYHVPASFPAPSQTVHPIRVVARAHDGPVHVCKVDPTSTYLASGSADGVVKVWDIHRGYVTHIFKGHGGVVSALAFNYPRDPSSVLQERTMQLITASVDTRIRIFELSATASKEHGALKPKIILEGHVSVPRGLDVTPDGKWLISGGRDSVVLLWDLFSSQPGESTKRGKGKRKQAEFNAVLAKTIPTLERVEAVGFISSEDTNRSGHEFAPSGLHFFTAGEKGVLKIWDGREGAILYQMGPGDEVSSSSDDDEEQRQILEAM
jgi:U3 small nucleolar RNA-associated protein 13